MIFRHEIKVGMLCGITSFLIIVNLLAPIDSRSIVLPLSAARKPFCIVIIVTIIVIITVIKTIDLTPLPNHTMIIGPSAILGRELRTIM